MYAELKDGGAWRIFVSYRRGDTQGFALLVYRELAQYFGRDEVFFDLGSIEPGDDFARRIDDVLGSCQVVVAVIGPDWLNATDERGRRRLEDPEDFVRLELSAALNRGIRLIPALVNSDMPSADDLPEPLKPLATRQAVRLEIGGWTRENCGWLIQAIEKHVGSFDRPSA